MEDRRESMDLATSAADMGASSPPSPSAGGGGRTPPRAPGDAGGDPLPREPEKAMATCRHFSVLLPTGTSSALTPSRFSAAMTSSDSFITDSTAAEIPPLPPDESSEPPCRRRNALILRRSSHSFSSAVAFSSREHSAVTADAVTASSEAGGPALGSARLAASDSFLIRVNSSVTTASSGVSCLNRLSRLSRSVLSCAISARS